MKFPSFNDYAHFDNPNYKTEVRKRGFLSKQRLQEFDPWTSMYTQEVTKQSGLGFEILQSPDVLKQH
jgi:hypothetical protein